MTLVGRDNIIGLIVRGVSMQSSEIRSLFLDFFAEKDHLIMPSFSLIPQNDPTLLLIGAGMAPLKPYFTGEKTPPHPRVATCQKCIRTPDIELVGLTGRHATFFEMLGNFSFGDYFKEDAIAWSWEFVTERLNLSPDKLWVSIYEEDEEAFTIWRDQIGVPSHRIVRMGKEDNFWEIGTGPCGPCSELHYDLGPEAGCGQSDCRVECDCDRFLEIWNLVFTQFNKLPNGDMVPLENKNIDTGAGLERLAMVMQGVNSIYELDTVKPLIDHITAESPDKEDVLHTDVQLSRRIIVEHLRGITFMVADGVLPANEGRGYVLRRLLRRAVRHGHLLGMEIPFLNRAVPLVISLMKNAYPELEERKEYIVQIVELEEQRFRDTLNQGMEILNAYLEEKYADRDFQKGEAFPGDLAFKLYDTYGFPLDLTREIVAEKGLVVDEEAFNRALEEQKEQARRAQKSGGRKRESEEQRWAKTGHYSTIFEGYDKIETQSQVLALYQKDSSAVEEAEKGDTCELLLDRTPFYAESGGQIGDTGVIEGENELIATVEDTYFNPYGQIVHLARIDFGSLQVGELVQCSVDKPRRQSIRRSHTSTHLLHRVLREFLGEHVNQSGSLVVPDRLRLDFTHFKGISEEELQEIEARLNRLILENLSVHVYHTDLQEAQEMGAVALFDEKYGDTVRIINIGDYGIELCGGTHLESTAEIGAIRLIREESIGAGIRRIEALTGLEAWNYSVEQENRLQSIAGILKTSSEEVEEKLKEWMENNRRLQQDYRELQDRLVAYQVEELMGEAVKEDDLQIISKEVDAGGMENLRAVADGIKAKLSRGVVVLGTSREGKVMLVAVVTRDLVSEGAHAGNLIAEVAGKVGGGGGGRPDMAQAGGKNPEFLPEALGMVVPLVRKQRNKQEKEQKDGQKEREVK